MRTRRRLFKILSDVKLTLQYWYLFKTETGGLLSGRYTPALEFTYRAGTVFPLWNLFGDDHDGTCLYVDWCGSSFPEEFIRTCIKDGYMEEITAKK